MTENTPYDEHILKDTTEESIEGDGNPRPTERVRNYTKIVTGAVTGVSVSFLIGYVAKKYVPTDELPFIKKAMVNIGVAAVTGAVVAGVKQHVDEEIDEFYDVIDEALVAAQENPS